MTLSPKRPQRDGEPWYTRVDRIFGSGRFIHGYMVPGWQSGEAIGFQDNHSDELIWMNDFAITPVTLKEALEHMIRFADIMLDDFDIDFGDGGDIRADRRFWMLVAKNLK